MTTTQPKATAPAARASTPSTGVRLTILAVLSASILLPFAVTGPAVILPGLARDLHASADATQWVQNAYNTVFAAAVLGAGSLADRLGRRRILRTGIAIFALSSIGIAVAPHIVVVDVLRAVQGLGAAGIIAAGAAVLAHATNGPLRVAVFGMLGASFGAGLAIGPVAAGALEIMSWRAVFAAIAVVAIAALVLSRWTAESRDSSTTRIDRWGMVAFGGALALMSLGFVSASTQGWLAAASIASFVGTIALLVTFVVIELRTPHAMFDVRLFRSAAFTAVICQPFAVAFGFVVLMVYLPVYLQGVGGFTPLGAAAALLPMTVPVLLVPLTAKALTSRFSIRALLVVASLCTGFGVLGLIVLEPQRSVLAIAPALAVFGIGIGIAFSVMDNAAVSTVPVSKAGAAAGMFNTMRIAGESLAVAASAAVLTSLAATKVGNESAAASLQGRIDTAATGAALTSAMHVVFIALAVMALLGALLTGLALRPTPTDVAD